MRLAAAALICAVSLPAHAAGTLSEEAATRKAADYLRGNEFGGSYFDIISHIRETKLITTGATECGPVSVPVWAFHVRSPYAGWLYLDAASGAKVCSSIPFYR